MRYFALSLGLADCGFRLKSGKFIVENVIKSILIYEESHLVEFHTNNVSWRAIRVIQRNYGADDGSENR